MKTIKQLAAEVRRLEALLAEEEATSAAGHGGVKWRGLRSQLGTARAALFAAIDAEPEPVRLTTANVIAAIEQRSDRFHDSQRWRQERDDVTDGEPDAEHPSILEGLAAEIVAMRGSEAVPVVRQLVEAVDGCMVARGWMPIDVKELADSSREAARNFLAAVGEKP